MPTLKYTFQGAGADGVKSQIKDIDKASQQAAAAEAKRVKRFRRGRAKARLKRIRAAKREAAAQERLAKRTANKAAKIQETAARKQVRDRAKQHAKLMKQRQRELKDTEKFVKRQRDIMKRNQAKTDKDRRAKMGKVARGALGLAGGAIVAGIGAAGAVTTSAARQQISLEEKARTLSIQARKTGKEGADPREITREAQATAIKVGGTTAESVLDAMSTFVTRTGRFDIAKDMAETFAVTARATGADASDIAGAAADLFEKFDIKKIDDMREAMAALTFQGKEGAFELQDAASQFPKLAAAAQRLGIGKGVGAVRTLGGLTQIARTSTGSPEAAATSLEAVFTGLTTNQKALKKSGVDVFDKHGKAKDLVPLLTDVITKVGGKDVGKKKSELAKIFGRQGIRALSPLIDAYTQALENGKDGAEGVANALNKAIDAPGTWGDVLDDAAIANESISAKLTSSWEAIVAASGDTLVPAITELATMLTTMMTEMGGIEAIGLVFDIVAENVSAFGDALTGIRDFLVANNLIEGPSVKKQAEAEKKTQADINARLEGKARAQEAIRTRVKKGQATEADFERILQLDKDMQELIAKRKASEKRQESFEHVAKTEAERLDKVGTRVEGKTGSEQFITGEQFTEAFIREQNIGDLERSVMQFTSPGTTPEMLAAANSKILLNAIQQGEQVSTLGYTEGQKELIQRTSSQAQALRSGIGVEQAPEGAIGLSSEQSAAAAAQMQAVASNGNAAAAALASVAASARADVGG